jgi:hypothetical protein
MASSSNNSTALSALSTDQVTDLCRKAVQGTNCHYIGTFAAWTGPNTDEWIDMSWDFDTAFVANTDVVEDEGTHWCLFYLSSDPTDPPFFFDSFGRLPIHLSRPYWTKYMQTVANKRSVLSGRASTDQWACNNTVLQDPHTQVCGQLCAMALYQLSRGREVMSNIVPLDVIQDFVEML